MFKIGETLIYIGIVVLFDTILTRNQNCIFKEYYNFSTPNKYSTIMVNDNIYIYPSNFFISLKEYRTQKLKKISKC